MRAKKLFEAGRLIVMRPEIPFQKRQYLLVLSHMRSYSSLFSHILGGHPEIDGYAEAHQSYHSSLSLTALRYRVARLTGGRLRGRYVHDKLLHVDHTVAPSVYERPDVRFVVMLRKPEPTLRSIVKLARRTGPPMPATPEGAATYYKDRVDELTTLRDIAPQRTLYLDAECIVDDTGPTLQRISTWLDLSTPLTPDYEIFPHTGSRIYGDSSPAIRSGTIVRKRDNNADIEIPPGPLSIAEAAYNACRSAYLGSTCSQIAHPTAPAAPDHAGGG